MNRAILLSMALTLSSSGYAVDFSLPDFLQEREGYSWTFESKEEKKNYTIHVLRLRSQTWHTPEIVDRHVWEHELRLIVPHDLRHPTAMVHVRGGKVGVPFQPTDPILIGTSVASGTILAELSLIPVQPLQFVPEEKQRSEDAIVAYTWKKFLETKEAAWPLHLPMAKAIVRSMDCVQDYCRSQKIAHPENFVLMGESKRAWASWLTASSDPRILAIVPIVCDFLNVKHTYTHHYRSLGGWSPAIRDYIAEGIDEKVLHTQAFDELLQIEDPYSYRSSYTMPKFLIHAAGDPFACPDSSQFYFNDLPSPKYLRYLPNAGHLLPRDELFSSVSAFYLSLVDKRPLPRIAWERHGDGSLSTTTDTLPLKVTVWKAENPDARDFRFDFTKVRWQSESLAVQKNGIYQVAPPAVKKGWAAYFVEYTFPHPLAAELPPMTFTTEIVVTPHTLPFSLPK